MNDISDIPFDVDKPFFRLKIKGFVYTLRGKDEFERGIHRVTSKYYKPNEKEFCAVVTPIDEKKICRIPNSLINVCNPVNALDAFCDKSGYSDVLEWLETLDQRKYKIPIYPETKLFTLYKVEKL